MYAGTSFPPAAPGEFAPYTIDMVNDLPVGQTVSAATVTLTVYQGTDSNPSSHLYGTPEIQGTMVVQNVGNLVAGNIYSFNVSATSSGGYTYELYSFIPCQDVL